MGRRNNLLIRNGADRPIRAYLIQSRMEKCFCVKRIDAAQSAIVRNVSSGHWYAVVVELGADFPIGGHPIELQIDGRGRELEVSGSWNRGGPLGYTVLPLP